jgi:cardiolipin synthase
MEDMTSQVNIMKKLLQLFLHRAVLVSLLIVLQIVVLILVLSYFNTYFVGFYWFSLIISVLAGLFIMNSKSNPAYKLAWMVPLLLFPVFGGLFYIVFGNNKLSKRDKKRFQSLEDQMKNTLREKKLVVDALALVHPSAANQARYIAEYAHSPLYQYSRTEYLPQGEVQFERMLQELESAEKFIFLEYFIIAEGYMWQSVLDILVRKVRQGVDVRLIYDDFGCVMSLPYQYDQQLRSLGIKCAVFNPLVPVLSKRLNTRDHRKICVIDGRVGFTGGANLADEYINRKERFGHWKDTGILIEGDAVWSLTVMFLSMWNYIHGSQEDFSLFVPPEHPDNDYIVDGFVQPFADNPLDDEPVGETVYLNVISKARRYIYISTPYLIIDNEMTVALTSAAKCGVDVRIITPHIPDKWYVHAVTRANYEFLLESGVRIYEYTPGFIHGKSFVVDDIYGIIGTINLDYRSLFLHFECATWMYRTDSVIHMRDDYLSTLKKCQEISLEDCKNLPAYQKLGRSLLRLFAPLM